jgi:transposase-like protein
MKTLRRPQSFCSNASCGSNEANQKPRLATHGWFRTRSTRRRRRICKVCGTTASATFGTPYHRMRRPKADLDRALHMSTEGMTASAIARVLRISVSTVTRWLEKAGRHAQAFSDEHDEVREPVELQLDELKSYGIAEAEDAWCYSGVEVWSRFWAALHVGKRTLRSTLLFVRQAREACGSLSWPILVTSDEFKYYKDCIDRTFGPSCAYVQVKNTYRRDRIVRTTWELVLGPEWRLDFALRRSEDGTRPNTSFAERLNLFERRSCCYLHRRTPGPARKVQRLFDALEILRVYYNYIRPHASLSINRPPRTPAMAAEIFDRPLSFRAILSWVPRPRGGLPLRRLPESTTLTRKARGCSPVLNS